MRLQRHAKKLAEYRFGVAFALGMLFPQERIRRYRKQGVPVIVAQRTKFDQRAAQRGLPINWSQRRLPEVEGSKVPHIRRACIRAPPRLSFPV